jgi:hypothetical protein
MPMVEIEWKPTDRQLRQFGLACMAAIPLVAWLATHSGSVAVGFGILGLALAALGWVFPQVLRIPFLALCLVAFPVGLAVSELILLAIWWLVMLPIGLCFRLVGRDALARRIQRDRASYWTPKSQPKSSRRYFHPF